MHDRRYDHPIGAIRIRMQVEVLGQGSVLAVGNPVLAEVTGFEVLSPEVKIYFTLFIARRLSESCVRSS